MKLSELHVDKWPLWKIDEYMEAIDPAYYTNTIVSKMKRDEKIELIKDLEYNQSNQHRRNTISS